MSEEGKTAEKVVKTKKFKLPGGKVTVRLVDRPRGTVNDKDHVMYNMVPGATISYCPRRIKGSKEINCPLTMEEIEFFEDSSRSRMAFKPGELSPYLPVKENFWYSSRATVKLSDRNLVLDLGKAADYLKYKILLSNDDYIAPNTASEFLKKTYVFVITSAKDDEKRVVAKGNERKRAWKLVMELEDDHQGMIDYLSVIGKRPSANQGLTFLQAEMNKQVDENLQELLSVLENPQYKTQILVTKCLQNKSIVKEGHKYFLSGGDPLCNTGEINNLNNTLDYLDADENQSIRLSLEARLEK